MKCPGCGAGITQAMIEAGECDYCHTALERPKPAAPAPIPVVHVTKIELGPRIEAGELGEAAGSVFDSVSTRLVGCVTGCFSSLLSALVSLVFAAAILGYVGWTFYVAQQQATPTPGHDHEHGDGGKGEKTDRGDKDGKGKHK